MQVLEEGLVRSQTGPSDIDVIIHGTTLATNAILERKGATTSLVTTEGFRDTIEMGFERFSTACANAYVRPLIERYLDRFDASLRERGFRCPLLLMLSSGGLTTVETAKRFPVRLMESGPAGGAIFVGAIARANRLDKAMSFDMGGTTAKICLVDGGSVQTSRRFEVARHDPFFGRCRKCHECGDDARRQARADSPECIPSPWFDRLSISQILPEVSASGDIAARLRRHRLADAECRSLPQVCPARRWLDATADGRVGDRVKRGPQRSHCRLVRSRASRSSSRRMPARKC